MIIGFCSARQDEDFGTEIEANGHRGGPHAPAKDGPSRVLFSRRCFASVGGVVVLHSSHHHLDLKGNDETNPTQPGRWPAGRRRAATRGRRRRRVGGSDPQSRRLQQRTRRCHLALMTSARGRLGERNGFFLIFDIFIHYFDVFSRV